MLCSKHVSSFSGLLDSRTATGVESAESRKCDPQPLSFTEQRSELWQKNKGIEEDELRSQQELEFWFHHSLMP